jgi:DNA ligase (NAD+)
MTINDLIKAADHYYNHGQPIMSDDEYDQLFDKLKVEQPDHPFFQTIGVAPWGTTVEHTTPVGSQEKLKTREEFNRWIEDGHEMTIQWKLDGLTVVLYYEDGVFTRALTRGNGKEGEDITRNVMHMSMDVKDHSTRVPRVIPGFTGSIRGEIMLQIPDFEEHFQPLGYRNPRNTAAGKARDQKADPEILKYLYIRTFDIIGTDHKTETERNAYMEEIKVFPVQTKKFKNADKLWESYKTMEKIRGDLHFEVDGVIVRFNDIAHQESLGMSSDLRPKGQRCIKFEAQSKSTILEDVEITIGHTGAQIPNGRLKPVEIGGVTVSNVLLNNWDEIERLGVAIGDKVEVIRAGDVIPKIVAVLEPGANRTPIPEPTECIKCSGPVERDGAHTICISDECEGKEFRRLKTWVTKRNIKFLGDELLMELYTNHNIRSPENLYNLTENYLSEVKRGNGVVGTGARHIMAELDKSRTATLPEFLGSLAIKFLGRRQVEIMMETCGLSTIKEFKELSVAQLESKPGFSEGGTKAKGIVEGIKNAVPTINGLLLHVQIEEAKSGLTSDDGVLAGKSFCFTGALPSGRKRTEAEKIVKENGGEIKSVSGKLTYLVIADPDSQSSKAKKARKLGVELISEEQFMDMIGVKA